MQTLNLAVILSAVPFLLAEEIGSPANLLQKVCRKLQNIRFALVTDVWTYELSFCRRFDFPFGEPHSALGDQCHNVVLARWRRRGARLECYTLGTPSSMHVHVHRPWSSDSEGHGPSEKAAGLWLQFDGKLSMENESSVVELSCRHRDTTVSAKTTEPSRATQTPEMHPQTPEMHPQTPEINPQTPEMHPQTPEMHPQTPEMHPQTPEINPQTLEIHLQTPEMYSQTPEMYSQTQEMYSQTQEMYPQTQEMYPQTQEMYPQTQEMYPQTQEMYPQGTVMNTIDLSVYNQSSLSIFFSLRVDCSGSDPLADDAGDGSEDRRVRGLWAAIICNCLLVALVGIIAMFCCRKGTARKPYDMLPGLHSSGTSFNEFAHRICISHTAEESRRIGFGSWMAQSRSTPRPSPAGMLRRTDVGTLISPEDLLLEQRLGGDGGGGGGGGGSGFADMNMGKLNEKSVLVRRLTIGLHEGQIDLAFFSQLASTLSKIKHKNLVETLGICCKLRTPHVALEFLAGAHVTVEKLLGAEDFGWPRKLRILVQVLDGLACLHDWNILHRDLRAGNVRVLHGEHAKLDNCGTVLMMESLRRRCSETNSCFCAKEHAALPPSIRWTAPEALQSPTSGEALSWTADIYSIGMLMWELTAHTPPFSEVPDEIKVWSLIVGKWRPQVEKCSSIPILYRSTMERCWSDDVSKRPKLSSLTYDVKKVLSVVSRQSNSNSSRSISRAESLGTASSYLKSALSLAD